MYLEHTGYVRSKVYRVYRALMDFRLGASFGLWRKVYILKISTHGLAVECTYISWSCTFLVHGPKQLCEGHPVYKCQNGEDKKKKAHSVETQSPGAGSF